MKITRIRICKTPLPYVAGTYVWGAGNAIRVARAVKDLDFILEQPCKTYEECQQVRRVAEQPMKLEECGTGLGGTSILNGKLYATDTPGLGVMPDFESLGAPVADFGAKQ